MTHSVESRFIAIVSGALLALVTPLFTILLMLSHHETVENQNDRLEILLVANAQALGRPLWDLDDESINQITGTLVTDPAVYMVKVRDIFGQLDITQTAGSRTPSDISSISRDITYKNLDGETKVGTITVFYQNVGLFASLGTIELAAISIFVLASDGNEAALEADGSHRGNTASRLPPPCGLAIRGRNGPLGAKLQ